VPGVLGAVYFPPASIVPPAPPSWIDHVTPVFDVPLTVAVNVCDAPATTVALVVGDVIVTVVVVVGVKAGVAVELPPQAARSSMRKTEKIATKIRMAQTTEESCSFQAEHN
jgi:hypothetical protein